MISLCGSLMAAEHFFFRTMSGRRTRKAVLDTLKKNGYSDDTVVVIAGLSNTYSDYVVTYEEYQVLANRSPYGGHSLL